MREEIIAETFDIEEWDFWDTLGNISSLFESKERKWTKSRVYGYMSDYGWAERKEEGWYF